MEAKDVAINLATSGVMLIVAASLVLVWKQLTSGMLRWISMGCLAWVVSVAVKAAIAFLTNEPIFNLLKSVFGNTGYIILGALWLGILTGSTEVLIGFWIARNRNYLTWQQGTGYGLGFGVIEAGFVAINLTSATLVEIFAPGNLPHDALRQIVSVSWDNVATVNIERIIAAAVHIATGMLIVYSIAASNMIAFWVAFIYKSMVDGVAGALYTAGVMDTWSPWLINALFFPFGVLGVAMILFLPKRWPNIPHASEAS